MRVTESCARCLYERQRARKPDAAYLEQVRTLIENRSETDTAPLLVYRFDSVYARMFGSLDGYEAVKHRANERLLEMEGALKNRIESACDPLAAALAICRVGNYIDYGAMDRVDESEFLSLFRDAVLRREEEGVYRRFLNKCESAGRFLLIADNCGEIVLDRLFLEQLKKRFPRLSLQVLVRGGPVLNDATVPDAVQAGVDRVARILSGGAPVAGTVYEMLPEEAKAALDGADVVLAKGQGNYESLSGQGRPAFYAFLCKCDLFTGRFHVPRLTAMLVEEAEAPAR